MPFCSGTSKPPIFINGDGITSAYSSSNESNVSQEQHWKRFKKKPKDLSDQYSEFADLNSISIDTAIFENSVDDSTMTLSELLGLGGIFNDVFGNDMFEDCITSLNPPSVAKNPHLPLDDVKGQVTNESPSTKMTLPPSENVELSQPNLSTDAEAANQIRWLREVNIIDLSPLEVLLEDFFKKFGDYDAARLSTSHKIGRDSHQELLTAAQQHFRTANEEKIKVDKNLGDLQKVLAKAEKELEA
ncbi:hypothetical protein HAX54_019062 [Datura stramonium]|uniref:Uncharacterized protein n=1 Tax=Datura stramonium TaxID=4076 RepID=A0ABS8UQI7_DATST|nr:hypothetical protein [Datura stramonium]